MAARSVKVTVANRSDTQFVVSNATVNSGIWTPGLATIPGSLLLETDSLTFQTESNNILTGTSGRIELTTTNLGNAPHVLSFRWDNPYGGANTYTFENVPAGLDAWHEGGSGDNAEVSMIIAPTSVLDTGFRPSQHGWHFSNTNWSASPNSQIVVIPGFLSIDIGKASDGMCGGMTYSALDYFLAGRSIPSVTTNPVSLADPHFAYIAERLWNSFHLSPGDPNPGALTTYVSYMGWGPAERANLTIKDALPKIRASISAGTPAALGLIGASASGVIQLAANLGENHQVCAFSYSRNGNSVRLGIYDCNIPDVDSVYIDLHTNEFSYPFVEHNTSMSQILAFFDTGYSHKTPP